MRVEIDDWNCMRHMIDSQDAETIGRWAAEKFRLLMSANACIGECRMRIWPSDQAEIELIGQPNEELLTQDGLLYFAGVILDASAKLAAIEEARSRPAPAPKSASQARRFAATGRKQ